MVSQEILRQENHFFSSIESMSLVHAHCGLRVLLIADSRPECSLDNLPVQIELLNYMHTENRER